MDDLPNLKRTRNQKTNGLAFFLGFLRHPDTVGSLVPSSRFLEQRLVNIAQVTRAKLVLELGPGTGGTTRAILDALPDDGKLLAIELDAEFVALLNQEADPRLIVHHGSAEQVSETLARYGLVRPQAVISGIPFSTMAPELGRRILHNVWSCLAPDGHFVAYQVRGQIAHLGRELLGKPETEIELLNVPPIRVYHWHKPVRGE
jgi:phosphatidylethanolamine/phosphatidyl-N-methylethanolamine N-methyltransferase